MSSPKVTEAVRLGDVRRQTIQAAVRGSGGDLNVAARLMRLSRTTFDGYVGELQIGGEVRRLADRARGVVLIRAACGMALDTIGEHAAAAQVRGAGFPEVALVATIRRRAEAEQVGNPEPWNQASGLLSQLAVAMQPDVDELVRRLHAPEVGELATCPRCQRYGKLRPGGAIECKRCGVVSAPAPVGGAA